MRLGRAAGAALFALALSTCGDDGDVVNPVHEGDLVLATPADVATASKLTRIDGALVIHPVEDLGAIALPGLQRTAGLEIDGRGTSAPLTVSLAGLTAIGGSVQVHDVAAPLTVELPALFAVSAHLTIEQAVDVRLRAGRLTAVEGDLRLLTGTVTELGLGALTRIGGSIRLERYGGDSTGSAQRRQVSLPALAAIDGDLHLRAGAPTDLALPLLVTVDGSIDIVDLTVGLQAPHLARIGNDLRVTRAILQAPQLDALARVGGDVSVTAVTIEGEPRWTFPALSEVAGAIEMTETAGLSVLELPALARLGGHALFRGLTSLSTLSLDGLAQAPSDLTIAACSGPLQVELTQLMAINGGLIVVDVGEIALHAPALRTITGSLRFQRLAARDLVAPRLDHIGQDLEVDTLALHATDTVALPGLTAIDGSLTVMRTSAVQRLGFPALATIGSSPGGLPRGGIFIRANEVLATLVLPALSRVTTDLVVRDNPTLPSQPVVEALGAVVVGGQRQVCGNQNGLPACP